MVVGDLDGDGGCVCCPHDAEGTHGEIFDDPALVDGEGFAHDQAVAHVGSADAIAAKDDLVENCPCAYLDGDAVIVHGGFSPSAAWRLDSCQLAGRERNKGNCFDPSGPANIGRGAKFGWYLHMLHGESRGHSSDGFVDAGCGHYVQNASAIGMGAAGHRRPFCPKPD